MKKKLALLFTICILSYNAFSQVSWVTDEKLAISLATANDKLILIDFWATWCGPCKTMDKKMWNTPELASLSDKIIPLKVDVDVNTELAKRYYITSIPRVVIITANGDIVWDQMGFSGAASYLEMINTIPTSLNGLNKKLLDSDNFTANDNYEVGLAYQKLAKESSGDFATSFFNLSDKYFKTASKEAESEELVSLAEMNELLNDAFRGKHEKVIKKVDKIKIPDGHALASDLKSYILAYCFKCDDNEKAFLAEKAKIQNEEYLNNLN